MANTVIELRHSYVTGNVPSSLANGEIAINTYDGKLFYRGGASNTIQTIERYQGPSGLNGEIQFNDSGVLGANSGLTFDKITGALTVSGNVSTTQYFIGDGSKLTGLAPALQIYSLANTASGVSDYMVLKSLDAYTVGTQNTTTTTVTTTPTILTSFITDVGFPNITSIPSGDIVVEFDTQKASGVGGYYCYAEIYKRTTGGTETLIATTGNSSSSTLNTQIQQRVNVYISTPVSLVVTDRIVVKIYAVMLTTSASISILFDGAADGALTLPVLPASTLNFVPYINATANVQLNSYSLITQTVSANSIVVLGRDLNAYANAAFARANNSLNANTDGTITGNLTVTGNITTSNISANVISIKTDGLTPIQLLSDNTVSSFRYTGKSFSVSTQETAPTGIHFKPDGTKMFVVGSTGDDINEYALSTPWEITTATFTRVTAALTDTSPQALRFSADGLSAYVLGDTNDTIYQHTLTEAWNVATLNTTATNTFSVTSQETAPTGLWFKPDGTKMFVVGSTGDDINEYNLSSAGNVATATFVQTGSLASPTGSTADGAPGSVAFNDDGTRLFVSGTNGEEINEYVLSTPYDVSTIRWVSYKYTGFESADPTGIFPALSNNFFYIISSSGDAVYQYATNANSLIANTHNFNVKGNVTLDYDQTIMGQQTVQSTATFLGAISGLSTATFSSTLTGSSTLSLTGATNSVTVIGTAATTGTTRIGGSTQTGEITIGFSTQNQTLNIANGATTSTNTKTVYIGAAGLSGSQTNVIIGSTLTGSRGNTNIYTPNVIITAANTAQTVVRIFGGAPSISNSTGTLIVNGGIAANGNVFANAVYDGGIEVILFANNAFNTANAAFTAANAATATDTTQNNSITAAFVAANSAGVYANGAFLVANSAAAYSNTVDATQNTSITAAFVAANSAGVYANGAFAAANSAGSYANSAFAAANNSAGVNLTQNNSITAAFIAANSAGVYANGAFARANNSIDANNGGTITGSLTITQNLSVGNLFVSGQTFSVNAGTIVANDTLLILGSGNYFSDTKDIGFAGHYNDGINAHSGFIRDIGTKEWYLFKGYTPEVDANNNVIITDPSFTIDTLNANVKSTTITIRGIDVLPRTNIIFDLVNAAFTAANSGGSYANSAFLVANSVAAYSNTVDATQNTSITAAFVAANSAGVYANGAFLVANSVAAYSNTVDSTQNTSITAAFTAANSAGVYANAAFAKANTASGASSSGYLANTIIFANSTGVLSNTNNLQFFTSNNTVVVAGSAVATIGDAMAMAIALG